MTDNSGSNAWIQPAIAMIGIMVVICLTAVVITPGIVPVVREPTPTGVTFVVASPAGLYQPEIVPLPTYTFDPPQNSNIATTETPVPTLMPTVTLTPTFISQPLPDLSVAGVGDPLCTPDHLGEKEGVFIKITFNVRNVGRAPTRSHGTFDIGVFLILGQQRYGIDEWREKFNGVVGASSLAIANLDPEEDVTLTLVLDLKGNSKFGIEVTANAGGNPIPEMDTTNNTLIRYFSIYCY